MTWTFLLSLIVFLLALGYFVAKLWRPFDAGGKPRRLWRKLRG